MIALKLSLFLFLSDSITIPDYGEGFVVQGEDDGLGSKDITVQGMWEEIRVVTGHV